MDGKVLVAEANPMKNYLKIKSDSRKPLKWGFFIPKSGLSESCQKKTEYCEFLHFGETHKPLAIIGGRGGIRTTFGSFFNFHYSATTTSLPEANSLITNERQ
jgi:hypothetical protein